MGTHGEFPTPWDLYRSAWAEEIAASRGAPAGLAPFLPLELGTLALRKGNWEVAHRLLLQALEVATGAQHQLLELAHAFLAELEILEHKAEEARDRLSVLVEEEGSDLPLLLPILAWAHVELGESKQALALADQSERQAREGHAFFYLPQILRVRGMALAGLGRREEARTVLGRGRERATAMPDPYTEARILVDLAMLDQQVGEGKRAREHLEEALAIFRRLGARKDVERAERVLAESL